MTRRGAAALGLALVAVVLLVAGVSGLADSGSDGAQTRTTGTTHRQTDWATDPIDHEFAAAVDAASPAETPFVGLTEIRLQVGAQDLRVVVSDEGSERSLGLRERRDLGPYAGMLFVFDQPSTTSFTMSTVPIALDIGFYDADGRAVGRRRMEPCAGSEAACPLYGIDEPFTYALETPAGNLPRGPIAASATGDR